MALLVLAAPTASAAMVPVDGRIASSGPATLQGDNGLIAQATAFLHDPSAAAAADFTLQVPNGRARLVNIPSTRLVGPTHDVQEVRGEEEVLADVTAAEVRFASDPDATVRVMATLGHFEVALAGSRQVFIAPTLPLPSPQADLAFAEAPTVQGQATRPSAGGAFVQASDLMALSWSEPFAAFAQGGTAVVDGNTSWATGRWVNATRSHVDPLTGSGLVVFDNRVVLVSGRGGSLHWPGDSGGWGLAASGLAGPLAGDAAWTDLDGAVLVDGKPIQADPLLLHLRGDLDLVASFGGASAGAADWHIRGEAHWVAVDGIPGGVVATAAGTAALAVAALATPAGRFLLAVVLGRHGIRLSKADPLQSPGRRLVLEAIHTHQPVRVTELRDLTGLARTAVAYHVRVLLAYDVIQSRRGTGVRNMTYMLNSGSLAFQVFGEKASGGTPEPTTAAEALAVANSHPRRRALYEAIRDLGPVDVAGLRARLGTDAAAAQSSLTHHLQALERAQAIRSLRDGKRKLYLVVVEDEAARVEQYRRFLRQVAGLDLVRSLADGPQPRLALTKGAPATARTLDRLTRLGLIESGPSARDYQLAPFLRPLARQL